MYSQQKANKLVREFKYLIGESYYPFGAKGREFKITNIEVNLKPLNIHPTKMYSSKKPKEEWQKEHSLGKNWNVNLQIENADEKLTSDLQNVLKKLGIKHDIDKISEN